MGYYTRFYGGFDLSRPLNNLEVEAVSRAIADYGMFQLDIDKSKKELPEGTLITKTAQSIYMPAEGEEAKWYDSDDHLKALVNALPEDVDVTGYIRAEGEESGDIWRYVVRRTSPALREVIRENPKLIWPDGTEEGGRR